MAKPIQATPILTGKDAERLLQDAENTNVSPEKQEMLKKCLALYKKIIAREFPLFQ